MRGHRWHHSLLGRQLQRPTREQLAHRQHVARRRAILIVVPFRFDVRSRAATFSRLMRFPIVVVSVVSFAACAPVVVSYAAGALASQGESFAADDDPELIAAAAPFGLKVTESVLEKAPDRVDLLVSAASGFTQYAFAFVQQPADFAEAISLEQAQFGHARAKRLYRRAMAYGLRALEAAHAGFGDGLIKNQVDILSKTVKADVPALYWTAAPWAARIVLSKNDPALLGDLGTVEALMRRALELDEVFDTGAIHEFFEAFEAARPGVKADVAKAKAAVHRDRALALSHGQKIGPYVTWASTVDVAAQDRAEFDTMIEKAVSFDIDSAPNFRLVNTIMQRRAQWLKGQAPELFVNARPRADVVVMKGN